MLLNILAILGAVFVLIIGVIVGWNLLGWFSAPVPYSISPSELERFLSSWGIALGDRGRIVVRQAGTDRGVQFVKRLYKTRTDQLVLRCRNADESRKYFSSVEAALLKAGIPFEVEVTPTHRPRALRLEVSIEDPLMPSAAAHAARLALTAMGVPSEGPYEIRCEGSHRPDYTPGSVEVIPWTRSYRSGFVFGQFVARIFGRN